MSPKGEEKQSPVCSRGVGTGQAQAGGEATKAGLWDQLGPFLGGRESGTGRLSTLATQPQLPTPRTRARTTGLSEPPGQEVVLCGPCVQFVKSYLKRDYNPATDTPTESMDRVGSRQSKLQVY